MDILRKTSYFIEELNKNIIDYLKKYSGENIYEPMAYSLNARGKRFRPILLLSMAESFLGSYEDAIPFAVAIECIHTYSLIHDDLPSMDDDDLRRGMPTCHKKFDEATAILAGDALLNIAFEVMIDKIKNDFDIKYVNAMQEIAVSAGSRGMIAGQVLDMRSENKSISEKQIFDIYTNKTAKLIIASMKAGTIIGEADNSILEKIENIGHSLGIAFQIQDDILDIIGDEKKLGKPIKSDLKNKKSTYITINGMENAKEYYKTLCNNVLNELQNIGFSDKFVYKYIESLMYRDS